MHKTITYWYKSINRPEDLFVAHIRPKCRPGEISSGGHFSSGPSFSGSVLRDTQYLRSLVAVSFGVCEHKSYTD